MTRVLLTGDWHLDDGANLGEPDSDLGSTRVKDAIAVLDAIAAVQCDVLVFLGDLARGPVARPNILRIAQEALASSPAAHIALVEGNHDFTGERSNSLDVVAHALPNAQVVHHAELLDLGELQLGALPWAPPQRLYTQAGGDRDRAHALVADRLADMARGMAAKLDARPSLLVGHWMLSGSNLASGADLLRVHEPLVSVDDLEASGPWGAIVFGHNHLRQRLGERTWVCGPPLRHSFGEAHLEVGYLAVDIDADAAHVSEVDLPDRRLVTVTVDVGRFLDSGEAGLPDVADAVVRLVGSCDEAQAQRLAADNGQLQSELIDACYMAGATKVIGPRLDVRRAERSRSDLQVDTDPEQALAEYLARRDDVDEDLAAEVMAHARRIMAGASDEGEKPEHGDELDAEFVVDEPVEEEPQRTFTPIPGL